MTRYWFTPTAAVDPITGNLVSNQDVQVFAEADTGSTKPLTVYDRSGLATASLHIGTIPSVPGFYADDPAGGRLRISGGGYSTIVVSYDYLTQIAANTQTLVTAAANASAASASTAADAANQAATSAAGRSPQGSLRVLRATSGGTGTGWSDGVTVYNSRPAYNGPIRFMSNLSRKPNADGVITGGGGMVPALDEWVQWTAQ